MKTKLLGVAACFTVLFSSQNVTAATVFTNRASWLAAVSGSVVTDTFSTVHDPGSITMLLDSGIVSQQTGATAIAAGSAAQAIFFNSGFGSVAFRASVNQGGPIGFELTWTMPGPINAFGGDFRDLNGAVGLTVTGNFDGGGDQTISIGQALGSSGFFGLVGSSSFSTMVWRSNDGCLTCVFSGENYTLDNFSFHSTPTPLPAALPLFATGLGALGLMGWRRKRKQSPDKYICGRKALGRNAETPGGFLLAHPFE